MAFYDYLLRCDFSCEGGKMKIGFAAGIAGAAIAAASLAFAQSAKPADVEINESECLVPDVEGVLQVVFHPALGGDAVVQSVITPSGTMKITCSGSFPEGAALPEGGAFLETGFPCAIRTGLTPLASDSHLVITSSGQFTLSCRYVPDGS